MQEAAPPIRAPCFYNLSNVRFKSLHGLDSLHLGDRLLDAVTGYPCGISARFKD